MVEAAVLATIELLASPLIRMVINKAHDHLGTGINERRKILAAIILPRLSLAIEKAENSPKKENLVDWLKRLKGAYYEVEEAIDIFEYELLKRKVKDERKTLELMEKNERGTRISLPSQFVCLRLKIALVKFKDILSIFSHKKIMLKSCINKLIEISKEADEFHDLLEEHENVDRETISDLPAKVFGHEIDKEKIVNLLTKKPSNSEPGPSTWSAIPIIAITGRSGVGKTILAQYVYKHLDQLGRKHFDLQVWVHVPRKFKAEVVINKMIEIIKAKECARNDYPFTSLEAIKTQLRNMLGSSKLLLVFDDFWSDNEDFVEQWENLISCLSSCLSGSKILLTSQSKNIAQEAHLADVTEIMTYNLKDIEEGQFSELFMHHAWPRNSHLQKEEFEIIGRKIAGKLKGDPGAAKLVGRQLRVELDLDHWKKVAEKDWLGDDMKARLWSFQQLPQHLHRCFAICSLFPKGAYFQKEVLIAIWMAEGFIRPTVNQESMEDIGENYLHELVSRFFLEQVVVNEIIYYQLHDLLHDLAERVQGDDFIRIDSTNSREVASHIRPILSRCENIRHIYLPSSMINELKEQLCLLKNIRTFFVEPDSGSVSNEVLQEIFKEMEKLRVIQLTEYDCELLPDSIGNLKHLRYLCVSGCRPHEKLPDSICKLYHLQTLGLPSCESLPKQFSELISLRHFKTDSETMSHISDVGRLTSLQCLDVFVVRKKRGYELHQLENLNQLRGSMCITSLENVGRTSDAVKANMQNKKHLEKLEFEWKSDERDTENVTCLSTQHFQLLDALQPHPNVNVLALKGFGGDRIPNWLRSQNLLRHLTSLTLMNCHNVEEISFIGESLLSCRSLKLQRLIDVKKILALPPNLTSFVIDYIPELTYLSEDDLLMKRERKQSQLEVVNQIKNFMNLEYVSLPRYVELTGKSFLQFLKDNCEALLEIHFPRTEYGYSLDQIFKSWVMCMQCLIEKIFDENEVSKLVLPSSLTYLEISSCSITSDSLSNGIKSLVSLSKLELSKVNTIISLPPKEVLSSLKNLQSITIVGCSLLSSLGGIGAVTSLIELKLDGCINLRTPNEPLPSSLERLEFFDCSNVDVILAKSNLPLLRALTVGQITFKNQRGVLRVGHLSFLKELSIVGWDGCLEGLRSLTSLLKFGVRHCPEIETLSLMDKCTSTLQNLTVDNPLLLKSILSNETISSLENLVIYNFQEDYFDDEIFQSLISLEYLFFSQCNINHLPKNLKNRVTFQYMQLDNCPNLICELEELPRDFRQLKIKDCPTLMEKFKNGGPNYRVSFGEGIIILTFTT